jgi:hypothetical protein
MLSVPVRGLPVKFSRTSNVIASGPLPLSGDVNMIQPSLLTAFHAHPFPVDKATLPVPPELPKKLLVRDSE